MVLFCITPPVFLFPSIAYKLVNYKTVDAVLCVDKNLMKRTRNLKYVENLKRYCIFKDILYIEMLVNKRNLPNTPKEIKEIYLSHFDNQFQKLGYDIHKFEQIVSINDNWDIDINLYLNFKEVHYFWLQYTKDALFDNEERRFTSELNKYINHYQSNGGKGLFASPILRHDSIQSMENMKGYTVWNRNEILSKLTDEEIKIVFKCFECKIEDVLGVALIICDSKSWYRFLLGYKNDNEVEKALYDGKDPRLVFIGLEDYTWEEVCSVGNSYAIDYYIDEEINKVYIKLHPNSFLTDDQILMMYGKHIKKFSGIPFEFLAEFLLRKKLKFSYILGMGSSCHEFDHNEISEEKWVLGKDFFRTWYFYGSLYVLSRLICSFGMQSVYAPDYIGTQLKLLCKKSHYELKIKSYKVSTDLSEIKSAFVVIDAYADLLTKEEMSQISKCNTIFFVNVDFKQNYIPLDLIHQVILVKIIKKPISYEKITAPLHRQEVMWIYSNDVSLRKKIRCIEIQKTLKISNIRLSVENMSLDDEIKFKNLNIPNIEILDKRDDEYTEKIEMYKALHVKDKNYGTGATRLFDELSLIIDFLKPMSILDYGCGKGRLVKVLKEKYPQIAVYGYDPAVPQFDKLFVKHVDLVINTDVLEHIPEKFLPDTIRKISEISQQAYFSLHHARAKAILENGENAHCTVKPPEWYHELFHKYFKKPFTILPGKYDYLSACCTFALPDNIVDQYKKMVTQASYT